MYLSLATNWDNNLIDSIKKLKNVKELWGALPFTPVGSGRGGVEVNISYEKVKSHINYAKKNNLEFCYLLNAPCLANQEYTEQGKKMIIKYIEFLIHSGVDTITVSSFGVFKLIKKNFSEIKIKASVILECDTLLKINRFIEDGFDIITLSFDKNRDFELLDKIPKSIRPKIEVLTSDPCLFKCHYRSYHYNQMGHLSQDKYYFKDNSFFYLPWYKLYYPILLCSYKRLSNLSEWIKARWIRPEDIKKYQKFGINRFKIGTRYKSTEWLVNCAIAYSNQYYNGNLLNLLSEGYFPLPNLPFKEIILIDNKKLDNFLEIFKNKNCELECSINCQYCENIAKEVITVIDKKYLKLYLDKLKELIIT